MVLSTNECVGLVNVVKVNASGANNVKATLNVTVNNVSYGTVDLTSTATAYTFEASDGGAATGEIVLTITQTSSVALYIKSISIN